MINETLLYKIRDWHINKYPISNLDTQLNIIEKELKELELTDNLQDYLKVLARVCLTMGALLRFSNFTVGLIAFRVELIEAKKKHYYEDDVLERMVGDKLEE